MKKCCWLYASSKVNTYSACFIGKSITELVEEFNKETVLPVVSQDRIYYREALLGAIESHGVNVSAVKIGDRMNFDRKVRYDEEIRALVQI